LNKYICTAISVVEFVTFQPVIILTIDFKYENTEEEEETRLFYFCDNTLSNLIAQNT